MLVRMGDEAKKPGHDGCGGESGGVMGDGGVVEGLLRS